mmetsp:Transcript_6142/g.15750  ORF Transcript_6142/g.15750 Transcript_6142/m.15750 type:complete len:184 (-) Transcript_6142:15-566(-)
MQRHGAAARRRVLLPLVCATLAATWGAAFLAGAGQAVRSPAVVRRAAPTGDDFDFGDMPSSAAAPKAPVKPPPASKPAEEEALYEEYDPDEDDKKSASSGDSDDGSLNFAVASIAALILAATVGGVFAVNEQMKETRGSAASAPRIKKVQASFDTYFDKDEAKELLKSADPKPMDKELPTPIE